MARGVLRENCIHCDKHVSECGELSLRGICGECGAKRAIENYRDLRQHSGPFFEHWRRRSLAAYGVVMPEATAERQAG